MHWFFPVALCIIVESIGVAIMDMDKTGIIKQLNHTIWYTDNKGGNNKTADIACANERVTVQHNQNCTQFHKHFI